MKVKEIEKKGINGNMVAKIYELGRLGAVERKIAMECLEVYESFEDFCENSEFAKSLNDDEMDSLNKDYLLKSKSCAEINGYFTHFRWLDWDALI